MSSYDDYISRASQSSNIMMHDSLFDNRNLRNPSLIMSEADFYIQSPTTPKSDTMIHEDIILESTIFSNKSNSSHIILMNENNISIRNSYIKINRYHYLIELVSNIIFLSVEKLLIYKRYENYYRFIILTMLKGLIYLTINLDVYYNNMDIVVFMYSCIYNNAAKLTIIVFLFIQILVSFIIDLIFYFISYEKYLINLKNQCPETMEEFVTTLFISLLYYMFIAIILMKSNYTEIKIVSLLAVYFIMNLIVYLPKVSTTSSYILLLYLYDLPIDYNLYYIYAISFISLLFMLFTMLFKLRDEII